MRKIKLEGKDGFAIVDDRFHEFLSEYTWRINYDGVVNQHGQYLVALITGEHMENLRHKDGDLRDCRDGWLGKVPLPNGRRVPGGGKQI